MSRSLARRFLAWSCLALGLLSALTPAQGLVLCVEAEGGVSIEGAWGAICCADRPAGGAEGTAGVAPTATPTATAQGPDCRCIDIPLASVADQRREPFRVGLVDAQRLFMLQPASPALRLDDERACGSVPVAADPRAMPPRVLQLGVVLLV